MALSRLQVFPYGDCDITPVLLHLYLNPLTFAPYSFTIGFPIPLCPRYNARCEGDKLLSYNFVTHILENRSNHCGNSCVDYVEIDFPNYGSEKLTTCGIEAEIGVMYSDGNTEIDVEFVANREEQAHGFMIFVWCCDPSFDINAYLNSSRRKRDSDQYVECAEPVGTHREPVDSV